MRADIKAGAAFPDYQQVIPQSSERSARVSSRRILWVRPRKSSAGDVH